MKKLTTLVVLTALLVTPTLPAWADGAGHPGLFGWFQSWLDGAWSWVTGEEGALIDPNSLTDDSTAEGAVGEPRIDPTGLNENQCTQEASGEGGGCIDPAG